LLSGELIIEFISIIHGLQGVRCFTSCSLALFSSLLGSNIECSHIIKNSVSLLSNLMIYHSTAGRCY
jgi:hypothetical protein